MIMTNVSNYPNNSVGVIDLNASEPQYTDEVFESTKRKRIAQSIIDAICIVIAFLAFIFVYVFLDPKMNGFYCNDTDIFYPHRDDTIQFWVVGIYGTFGPIIIILVVELLNSKLIMFRNGKNKLDSKEKRKHFFISILHALSLFILGIGLTLLVTEIGKRWVGRLRPHFMDVCKPDFTKFTCLTTTGFNQVYNYIDTSSPSFCTGDAALVKEARLSFPSGHSSFAWYTMIFLIVYLEARLNLTRFRFIKPMIQITAFIAAYVTMVSRVSDYHHRGSDVIGGTVIGVVIGLFITIITGRVLWVYNRKTPYYDFDLKYNLNTLF
jgi:phosphatidate phosphatase